MTGRHVPRRDWAHLDRKARERVTEVSAWMQKHRDDQILAALDWDITERNPARRGDPGE